MPLRNEWLDKDESISGTIAFALSQIQVTHTTFTNVGSSYTPTFTGSGHIFIVNQPPPVVSGGRLILPGGQGWGPTYAGITSGLILSGQC